MITVESIIRTNSDNFQLDLWGANNYTKGAFLSLRGMNSSESGSFILSAVNSEINYMDGIHRSDLVGYPEGWLEWNNTSLSDIAVKAKQITSYGYISFNC